MNIAAQTAAYTASATPAAPAPRAAVSEEAARHTAREFESLFLTQFAQVLFSSVKSDGPFGGGPAEDIFKGLLAEEYGKNLAHSGGIGIADSVYRQLIQSQEVS
jgi:Rod binding domain-containing protein